MSHYTVYVIPKAWQEIKNLPGSMRQRIKKAIDGLAEQPYPSQSKKLNTPDIEYTLCRLRLDKWRIVYAIDEKYKVIDVLTVRKRPPYDYGDLEQLLEDLM